MQAACRLLTGARVRIALAVLLLVSCAPAPEPDPDAGVQPPPDAGVDAGQPDAGTPDAGTPDAGLSQACFQRQIDLQGALNTANLAHAQAVAVASEDCPTLVVVHGPRVTEDSLWREGSVTKTYVAATVVKMAGDGQLGLDDTLDKFALQVPDAGSITVRQLLSHTSGLFDYTADTTFPSLAGMPTTPDQIVALATAHAPYFAPGMGWHYSNTNFILLGMIVKQLSGKELSQALLPLPPHTFLDGEMTLTGTLVPGYNGAGNDVTHGIDPTWTWAAGGMASTLGDQADWIHALYSGRVLSADETASLSAMPVQEYGLGTMIVPAAATGGYGQAVGHGGDLPGYHCMAFYFPQKQRTIAVAVDSDALDPNALFIKVMDAALE
jgi:D-alanyl-D-alanine carboxypeptidase